jgi:hypothetical protein
LALEVLVQTAEIPFLETSRQLAVVLERQTTEAASPVGQAVVVQLLAAQLMDLGLLGKVTMVALLLHTQERIMVLPVLAGERVRLEEAEQTVSLLQMVALGLFHKLLDLRCSMPVVAVLAMVLGLDTLCTPVGLVAAVVAELVMEPMGFQRRGLPIPEAVEVVAVKTAQRLKTVAQAVVAS